MSVSGTEVAHFRYSVKSSGEQYVKGSSKIISKSGNYERVRHRSSTKTASDSWIQLGEHICARFIPSLIKQFRWKYMCSLYTKCDQAIQMKICILVKKNWQMERQKHCCWDLFCSKVGFGIFGNRQYWMKSPFGFQNYSYGTHRTHCKQHTRTIALITFNIGFQYY